MWFNNIQIQPLLLMSKSIVGDPFSTVLNQKKSNMTFIKMLSQQKGCVIKWLNHMG